MKPRDWDELSNTDKLVAVHAFIVTARGRYVIGQALAIASLVMRDTREISNAEDMEMLGFGFEPFFSMELDTRISKTTMLGGQT